MRNGVAIFCLVVLGASCGGGAKSTPPSASCDLPKDGTRLKAYRLQAEDGAWEDGSRDGQWYDAGLGTLCRFQPATDGALRCLPFGTFGWAATFADAACSQRIVEARPCLAAPPQYTIASEPETCAGGFSREANAVYRLGSGSVPAMVYAKPTPESGCYARPNDQQKEYFPLLEQVPPAEFVAAAPEPSSTGTRIQTIDLSAEDGARGRSLSLPVDTTFNVDCMVQLAADGTWRCLPFQAYLYNGVVFADASCAQPLIRKPERACDPAFQGTFAGLEEAELCAVSESYVAFHSPRKVHVLPFETPTTLAQIFVGSYAADGSPTCDADLSDPALEFVRLGAERAPAEFVRATDTEAVCGSRGGSGSRLKVHHMASDDGAALSGYMATWVDAQTGQECNFSLAADGVIRCLPNPGPAYSGPIYFADAGCTRGLAQISRCVDYARGAPKYNVTTETGSMACLGEYWDDVRSRVHALGPAITPTALYTKNYEDPPRCVPVEQTGSTSLAEELIFYEFREIGAEVPPSTFVAATLTMP